MKYYEIVTLKVKVSQLSQVGDKIQAFICSAEAKGKLLGAWFSDIGQLNEVYLLRGYQSEQDLINERKRVRLSSNPFNCAELLDDMQLDSYIPFDFMPVVSEGDFGPIYEIRTYHSKVNGLAPTQENWRDAIPERSKCSNVSMIMYALDGKSRFTHIWSYRTIEDRTKIRSKVVSEGVWPPKGAAEWLTSDMISTVVFPMPFSPLK